MSKQQLIESIKNKCICNFHDNNGPLNFDEDLKNEIIKKGILFKNKFPSKYEENSIWGYDLRILHLATGKVNSYSCYANKEENSITIFNGFFQEPINTSLTEFMWIYEYRLIDFYNKQRKKKGLLPIHKFKRGQIFQGNPNFKAKKEIVHPKGRYFYVLDELGNSYYQYEKQDDPNYKHKHQLEQYEIDEKYYIPFINPPKEILNLFKYNLKGI